MNLTETWAKLRSFFPKTLSQETAELFARFDAAIDALASRAPAQALGGDKALEFAEYMAKGAEQLLEAMNEHAAALMALEEGSNEDADVDITEQTLRCERAEQALSEFMTGLRDDVYEFRKRRDRAVLAHRATAQAPEQPVPSDRAAVDEPVAVDEGSEFTDWPTDAWYAEAWALAGEMASTTGKSRPVLFGSIVAQRIVNLARAK